MITKLHRRVYPWLTHHMSVSVCPRKLLEEEKNKEIGPGHYDFLYAMGSFAASSDFEIRVICSKEAGGSVTELSIHR